jgi:hypothetical protein
VPSRDGDRPVPSQDEQLVAQIIPLRQRTDGPLADDRQTLADPQLERSTPPGDERSAWEPPAPGELRRRATATPARSPFGGAAGARRVRRTALATAGALATLAVVTALGLTIAPAHPSARRSASASSKQALAASAGKRQPQKSRPRTAASKPRAPRRAARRFARHATHRSSTPASTNAGADPDVQADASLTTPRGTPAEQANMPSEPTSAAEQPAAQPQHDASEASESVSSSEAVSPAARTASSTAQSECVPGELGC